jgi:superfamily II DNA or RNA helicase
MDAQCDDDDIENCVEFENPVSVKRPKLEELLKPPVPKAFGRDLNKDHVVGLKRLKQILHNKAKHCTIDGAYRIPLKCLTGSELGAIRAELITKPKPSYNKGRRVDKSWELYILTSTDLLLPRPLGIKLCGLPPKQQIHVVDNPVEFPEPLLPLLDDASASLVYKTAQEGHVTKCISDLNKGVETQGFGSALYSIPTGHGKTASAVIMGARLGQRILFMTHNDSVHTLNVDDFQKFLGPDLVVGKMQTSNKRSWKNIDALIVQTTHASAAAAKLDVTQFGTVIVDEAHKVSTPELKKIFFRFPCKYLIMLTATPSRAADHCGAYLEWLGGPVSCYERINFSKNRWGGVTVREIPYVYRDKPIAEKRTKDHFGKWHIDLPITHNITMYRKDRNIELVNQIEDLVVKENRHVVVVAVRILHVERIAAALNARGISAGVLIGEHTNGKKQTSEERVAAFKCRVLVAYISLAVEALNLPRLDTVMQASGGCPWNNETFWIQFIGRIMRDKINKNKPLIVLPRDETVHGVFERQVDKAKKQFIALGDGFEFIEAKPVQIN